MTHPPRLVQSLSRRGADRPCPKTRLRRAVLSLGLGLAITLMVGASPTFWRVSTQAEFLRGEVDSLSIDANGHLVLGPVADEFFETTALALWSLTSASDGAIWVGSGSDGRLYRIGPDGTGSIILDTDEIDIHTVVPADAGAVLAATSPDGRIYRVNPDGQTTTVLDPNDTYIWALAQAPDGTLYAATGDMARIYRIPPGGDGEVFFQSDATHVLSLAIEDGGALLAGTESPGQVLRIDQNGRAFVLLDSPYEEIRSLRVQSDGSVLVVAINSQTPTGSTASAGNDAAPVPVVSATTSRTSDGGSVVSAGSTPPPATSEGTYHGGRRGAVYRIAPDGLWDELWSSESEAPYDAVFDANGTLIVGTGGEGRIYQVSATPPRTVLLARSPARQITRFLQLADGSLRYGTANPGKVISLTGGRADRGTYESAVHDAETVATWGSISWRGTTPDGSRIELSSRSGNTAIPNELWSEWSASYTDAAGTQIASPNARYLQWRASLFAGDASPVLTSVDAAYLPRNLRPAVTQITAYPPGTVFQQQFSSGDPPIAGLDEDVTETEANGGSTTLGRQSYRKGIQTFAWQAADGNGDRLEYTIHYQTQGEAIWHALRSGLRETVFAWDTSSVPDGAYRVKITASDTSSNAPGIALLGELESQIFDVDNTAPRIEVAALRELGDRSVLPFTVSDDQTPIQLVEISEGDDTWHVVYPTDGIPDELVEQFEVVLNDPAEGTTIIRATDALQNVVTAAGR